MLVRYDRDPVIKAKGDQKSKGEFLEERITLSSIRTPRLGVRGSAARRQAMNRQQRQQQGGGGGGRDMDIRGGRQGQPRRAGRRPQGPAQGPEDDYLPREAKEFGRQVTLISEHERKMENPLKGVNPFDQEVRLDPRGQRQELVKKCYAELVWHGKDESNATTGRC